MLKCAEEVRFYTERLTRIQSIVNTEGEREIADVLYQLVASFPYFQDNPNNVSKQQTVDDDIERYNVFAIVRGNGKSNRTVILMGHMDTVGVDDFRQHEHLACHPDKLMEHLQTQQLEPDVERALHSGEWMFGRGVLDMKSGLASHLYLLRYYSEHPEKLNGNLVFVAACDEEDSSHGMLSATQMLKQWKHIHQFEYVAAINSDFVSPRSDDDPNRYIYKGTVGKLLPAFFITGAETHVGACLDGLDPNFVSAHLTRRLNYNPDLCEIRGDEITVPPVCLKQTDLKPYYTVQTALSAFSYFNFYTYTRTASDVLDLLKEEARCAFEDALHEVNDRNKTYSAKTAAAYTPLPFTPRVMSFAEMEEQIKGAHGSAYSQHMKSFKQQLVRDESLDVRMFACRVVEEAWKWMPDASPAIIVFYASLYSPPGEMNGATEAQRCLEEAVDTSIERMQAHYAYPIKARHFYPYISDMSFVFMNDDETSISTVEENNPAWGSKHFVHYRDVLDLNVPAINIGPYGYDAHQGFERMECSYSLEIVPNLTHQVIEHVLHPPCGNR